MNISAYATTHTQRCTCLNKNFNIVPAIKIINLKLGQAQVHDALQSTKKLVKKLKIVLKQIGSWL